MVCALLVLAVQEPFVPDLTVSSQLPVPGGIQAGQPVTLGVVVANESLLSGEAFVVAAPGDGIELEGPTVRVPGRGTALLPVQLVLPPGESQLSLVVFDTSRGVRRISSIRELSIRVDARELDGYVSGMPDRVARGEPLELSIRWENPGMIRQAVVPIVVFRPMSGGPPVAIEGAPLVVDPWDDTTLVLSLDTWPLRSGTYRAQVMVRSPRGGTLGRTAPRWEIEVVEPSTIDGTGVAEAAFLRYRSTLQ